MCNIVISGWKQWLTILGMNSQDVVTFAVCVRSGGKSAGLWYGCSVEPSLAQAL